MNERQYQFEWDEDKAAANFLKHGVRFESAVTVFQDPRLLTIADVEHSSTGDERWFSVGMASTGAMLTIIYRWTEDANAEVAVRLISVRKATRDEILGYGWEA